MVRVLTAGAVLVPFLAGLGLVLWARRVSAESTYRVALGATVSTVICFIVLLPHADSHAVVALQWKPGAGAMGLAPGATSLWSALATVATLAVVLVYQSHDRHSFSVTSGATMLMAMAAANVAFLADHFLARYVALEVVALCVALALLVDAQRSIPYRRAWTSYLLLRVGDAGLLAAIFILFNASGTLNIKAALEAGGSLQGAPLALAVTGFALAVWVKLGGWPFHVWSLPGPGLSVGSHAWLYATVMSNLGLYLLYRVTPLLGLPRALQVAVSWVGAGGAALASLLLLARTEVRIGLVYLGAAQAGLALFAAASGLKSAIWLSVILLTPLRILLFLAADWSERGIRRLHRGMAGGLFALAGFVLLLFNLLIAWWAREASAPLDALLAAEAAIVVCALWLVRTTRSLLQPGVEPARVPVGRIGKVALGAVALAVLATGVKHAQLIGFLITSTGMHELRSPGASALLRHTLTVPAVWAVVALALGLRQLQRRPGYPQRAAPQVSVEVRNLDEVLSRAAQVLHAVVEVGLLERTITVVTRAVTEGSGLMYRVIEQDGLGTVDVRLAQTLVSRVGRWYRAIEVEAVDGLQQRLAGMVVDGAKSLYHVMEGEGFEELLRSLVGGFLSRVRATYRVVEKEGVDQLQRRAAQTLVDGARVAYRQVEEEGTGGILKPIAQGAVAWARGLQRWQTGRLRVNLYWVVACLAVAVAVVGLSGW